MTDDELRSGRETPPTKEEWPNIWRVLRGAETMLRDLGPLADFMRLVKKPWFWIAILTLATVAAFPRVAATIETLGKVMGVLQ